MTRLDDAAHAAEAALRFTAYLERELEIAPEGSPRAELLVGQLGRMQAAWPVGPRALQVVS